MKLNDFKTDLEYSLEDNESDLFDNFYRRVFPSLVEIENVTDLDLQMKGIDKIIHFKENKKLYIDEKKRRKDYGDIILEIWSNTEKRKAGWIFKSHTDYIVYAIIPSRKCYLLPALLLKIWVKNNWLNLKNFPKILAKNKYYTTTSYAIPTDKLLNDLKDLMVQEI